MLNLVKRLFPVGRRSLIFGVHQFIFHPFTVYLAWVRLYGFPNWKETVCIIIHDWGYWFCQDMDGDMGKKHPEFAANIALKLFGQKYADLCLYHSRYYAKEKGVNPSPLCDADKLSIIYETWWSYIPRAWLSGELFEYRFRADREKFISLKASHREWFNKIQDHFKDTVLRCLNDYAR